MPRLSPFHRLVLQVLSLFAGMLVIVLVLAMVAYILTAPMFGGGPLLR